jgi:hypothetical protein
LRLLVNQKNRKDLNQLTNADIAINLVTGKIVVLNIEESLEMMTEGGIDPPVHLLTLLLVIDTGIKIFTIEKRREEEDLHLPKVIHQVQVPALLQEGIYLNYNLVVIRRKK